MSGFLDKAKEVAENVKDKIEDKLPDSVKEKLHIGGDKDEAAAGTADGAATEAAETPGDATVATVATHDTAGSAVEEAKEKAEELRDEVSDKIEDVIPGDSDGDGH